MVYSCISTTNFPLFTMHLRQSRPTASEKAENARLEYKCIEWTQKEPVQRIERRGSSRPKS